MDQFENRPEENGSSKESSSENELAKFRDLQTSSRTTFALVRLVLFHSQLVRESLDWSFNFFFAVWTIWIWPFCVETFSGVFFLAKFRIAANSLKFFAFFPFIQMASQITYSRIAEVTDLKLLRNWSLRNALKFQVTSQWSLCLQIFHQLVWMMVFLYFYSDI